MAIGKLNDEPCALAPSADANAQTVPLSKNPILPVVILVLFGLIVAALLLEGVIRLLPVRQAPRQRERPHTYYLPPQAHTARGNVFALNKDPKVKRIGVVGDSFTFGPKIHFFDTFPARLERLFNLNSASEVVEVINYGSPGFSTHHEVALVEKAIEAQCDLIVLEITLNDAQEEPLRHNPLVISDDSGLFARSKLYQFVSNRVRAYRSRQKYIDYHTELFSAPRTQSLFLEAISKMKAQADLQKVPLVAVVFPLIDFPIDDNYPFKELHRQIGSMLTSKNIPVFDLTNAFYGIDVKRLQLIPDRDSHPNEIGHRIAADAIHEWLKGQKVLPPSLFTARAYRSRNGVHEKQITSSHAHRSKMHKKGEQERSGELSGGNDIGISS